MKKQAILLVICLLNAVSSIAAGASLLYFAYGHSKAQEQYGFHNPADMDKVIKELNKK